MTGLQILLVCWLTLCAVCWGQQMAPNTLHTVEGHAFHLSCSLDCKDPGSGLTFTWTKDNKTLNTSDPRIRQHNSTLWFLPAELADKGYYSCKNSNSSESTGTWLSVGRGQCPDPNEDYNGLEESKVSLFCSKHVPNHGQVTQMNWWRNCKPMGKQGQTLTLYNVSVSDTQNYTCMISFIYEGKTYDASHSIHLTVIKKEPVVKPRVIHPLNETLYVQPGEQTVLECSVFFGSEEMETLVYWTVNDSFTEKYPQLKPKNISTWREDDGIYGTAELIITEVLPEFFNVPFNCLIDSPAGADTGQVFLRPAKHIHVPLSITLLILGVFFVGVAVVSCFFKVDLVLACRQLQGDNQDGPLYNAYVSYFQNGKLDSSGAEKFALNILPEVLEHRHGLKLYISGRDDENAEGVAEIVRKSRAVVIVLSASDLVGQDGERLIPVTQGHVEWNDSKWMELCDVISSTAVPVILVEGEMSVDDSLLPDNIRTIKQKKKVLRWTPAIQPNGRFWKNLRYHLT